MVTPLISKLRTQGGTLYTFSSASRDLTRVFTNNNFSFKFSKFACLNLPDLVSYNLDGSDSDSFPDERGLDLQKFGCSFEGATTTTSMNKALAEHMQNYVMNFETALLNGEGDNDDYDQTILQTVTERVFFNWLQKVGGIKFAQEYVSGKTVYVEDVDSKSNRTVVYLGNIDAVNSVEVNGDAFDEVYLHIPSNVGATPNVNFVSVNDNNYKIMHEYRVQQNNGFSNEHIIGRVKEGSTNEEDIQSSYGLSLKAFYDTETLSPDADNIYSTVDDRGYCINFNGKPGYASENLDSTDNFEFNTVLIYYDFSDGKNVVTNLYGVLFLEEITDMTTVETGADNSTENVVKLGYIRRYPKYKETTGFNGNSFGLKVDIKIDCLPDTTGVAKTYVDPNSTVAMELYMNALTKMQDCADIFYKQQEIISKLQQRVTALESLTYGMDSVNTLWSYVESIRTNMNDSGNIDGNVLLELINSNSDKIEAIANGKTTVDLQYNTDVLQAGYGVAIDKNTANRITINSKIPSYSVSLFVDDDDNDITTTKRLSVHSPLNSYEPNCYAFLKEGTNLGVLYIDKDENECTNNLHIYINDSNVNWKVGQSYQIIIRDEIDFAGWSLKIHTGHTDSNTWSQTITVPGDILPHTPLVEMVCLDPTMDTSGDSFLVKVIKNDMYII